MPDSVDLCVRACERTNVFACVCVCLFHRNVEIALIVRANMYFLCWHCCAAVAAAIIIFNSLRLYFVPSLVENVLEYVCMFMLFSLLCGAKKTRRLLNMKSWDSMTSNLVKHPDSKQLFTLDCKFNDKVTERSRNKQKTREKKETRRKQYQAYNKEWCWKWNPSFI